MSKLYRIWFGTSNDRSELGRATADDIDQVIELVKTEYLKPDTEFYDIDYQGNDQVYLMIDLCKDCEFQDSEYCMDCETSEYVEITEDTEAEAEYKTIFGTNEYYDLTDPQNAEKSKVFNNFLFEAWNTDPQLGVSALIIQTIKDHPELEKGFSRELIEKSKRELNQ